MSQRYRATLTAEEREELEHLLARGKAEVRRPEHAQIMLKADQAQGRPAWPGTQIAEAPTAGNATVERIRRGFVEEGSAAALSPYRGSTRAYATKRDGAQEAHFYNRQRPNSAPGYRAPAEARASMEEITMHIAV